MVRMLSTSGSWMNGKKGGVAGALCMRGFRRVCAMVHLYVDLTGAWYPGTWPNIILDASMKVFLYKMNI